MATGVRSSCAASAVKRVCRAKVDSSWAKVSLRTVDKWPSSLPADCTGMRSLRSPVAMRWAVSTMLVMGRRARAVIHQPMARAKASTEMAMMASQRAYSRRLSNTGAMDRPTSTHSPGGVKVKISRRSLRLRSPCKGLSSCGLGGRSIGSGALAEQAHSVPSRRHTA